jgi:hypothetical protein
MLEDSEQLDQGSTLPYLHLILLHRSFIEVQFCSMGTTSTAGANPPPDAAAVPLAPPLITSAATVSIVGANPPPGAMTVPLAPPPITFAAAVSSLSPSPPNLKCRPPRIHLLERLWLHHRSPLPPPSPPLLSRHRLPI